MIQSQTAAVGNKKCFTRHVKVQVNSQTSLEDIIQGVSTQIS